MRTKFMAIAVCCILALGLSAQAATTFWPQIEQDTERNNRFIVEVRVRYGNEWFRLDTGPRPEDQARLLYEGLDKSLVDVPHHLVLIDLNQGESKSTPMYVPQDAAA